MSNPKLGIIGGGQLGSLMELAARNLNIKILDINDKEHNGGTAVNVGNPHIIFFIRFVWLCIWVNFIPEFIWFYFSCWNFRNNKISGEIKIPTISFKCSIQE